MYENHEFQDSDWKQGQSKLLDIGAISNSHLDSHKITLTVSRRAITVTNEDGCQFFPPTQVEPGGYFYDGI